MKREKLQRIFLYLWLAGSLGSFLLHFFFPTATANNSLWNMSAGWQREIALWNLGVACAIMYVLKNKNGVMIRGMVILLSILSLLFGTNHLLTLMMQSKRALINLIGVIGNYAIMLLGISLGKRQQ